EERCHVAMEPRTVAEAHVLLVELVPRSHITEEAIAAREVVHELGPSDLGRSPLEHPAQRHRHLGKLWIPKSLHREAMNIGVVHLQPELIIHDRAPDERLLRRGAQMRGVVEQTAATTALQILLELSERLRSLEERGAASHQSILDAGELAEDARRELPTDTD